MAKTGLSEKTVEEAVAERRPVLVVAFGRGNVGKSLTLAEMAWRAGNFGRDVLVADFDPNSKTLRTLFPDAIRPDSVELPDVKAAFAALLNRVAAGESAVVDFGGGDDFMREYAKELEIVEFADMAGFDVVAVYVLSPDRENLEHCLSVFESGHFLPKKAFALLNEGVILGGKTVLGAFEPTMKDPRFRKMVDAGVRPMLMPRMPCIDLLKTRVELAGDPTLMNFYRAAAGDAGLDLVERFQAAKWLKIMKERRTTIGVEEWLP
jgi:hypothetical protein